MSLDPGWTLAAGLVGSYLLGSIPGSFLIAWYGCGVDLRKIGSGNVGATNVLRSLGPRAGIPAAILDIGKGTLAVLLARAILPGDGPLSSLEFSLACGVAAVAGHTYTIFLGFKGGKGVATGAGVFLAIAPLPLLASSAVFVTVVAVTRYVSLGSILAALTLPMWIFFLAVRDRGPLLAISSVLALFIVLKHRENLGRLVAGTESRIGSAPPAAGSGERCDPPSGA